MKGKIQARSIFRGVPVGLLAGAVVLAALFLWYWFGGQRAAPWSPPDTDRVVLEEACMENIDPPLPHRLDRVVHKTTTLTRPEDIAALWKELRGIRVSEINRPMDSGPRLTITFYSAKDEILYQFHGDSGGTLASTSLGPGNRAAVDGYDYAALAGWMDKGI